MYKIVVILWMANGWPPHNYVQPQHFDTRDECVVVANAMLENIVTLQKEGRWEYSSEIKCQLES